MSALSSSHHDLSARWQKFLWIDWRTWTVDGKRTLSVTRTELIDRLALSASISDRDAGQVLSAVLDTIAMTLAEGGRVELRGFGAFSVRHRSAREARNPRTGETVLAAARKGVHFKAGRKLAQLVNDEAGAKAALQMRREDQLRRRDEKRGQMRLF